MAHRLIPDDGPRSARIVVVGEMDATHEEAQGRHLVGPSGQLWSRWLTHAGLLRPAMYVTNVIPYRAHPSNKIAAVPKPELEENVMRLHERLAALTDPYVIVPLGNTALRALTGHDKITKYRGSILEYASPLTGRRTKVIPTIHPAAIIYQKGDTAAGFGASSGGTSGWERRCLKDWERIASDATFRELRLPQREHFIEPTWADLCDYVADAEARAEILVIDIETPHTLKIEERLTKKGKVTFKRMKGPRRMTVFGASFDPAFGFVIPTTEEYWAKQGVALADVMAKIQVLCNLDCDKGGQSADGFDRYWLWRKHGISVSRYVWDTRWMSHCYDPLDEHSLAYQASTLTREPFWKDDGKEDDTETEGRWDIHEWWRYNSRDTTVERELVDTHMDRLGPRVTDYLRLYKSLYESKLHISVGGMRVNTRAMTLKNVRWTAESLTMQDKLTAHAGFPLYGPKGSLSSKKLQTFLYTNLGLPAQKDRKTGKSSTKEVIVRKLMLTPKGKAKLGADDDANAPGRLILDHRRIEVLKRFTKEGIADPDGYARSQIGWTYTLRFAMSKNPCGTGNNNQNTDRELLDVYVPDPGHVFIETDLSQAEDRVVKVLAAEVTKDPKRREELLWRARAMPWENDEHKRAAVLIFNTALDAVTKSERYVAKRSRHSSNYGTRGQTFSESLMKEGYTYTAAECDAFIDIILDKDTPEVRDWQMSVRQRVLRYRQMENSWGTVVPLKYERLGDDLYRQMYAFEPQSEVTGIIKYWGLVPLHKMIAARRLNARIANEKHDSLLISSAPEHVWEIMEFLRPRLERPRLYHGIELMIPTEFKLGRNAAMQVEWKKFPKRSEVDASVQQLMSR